MCNEINFNVIFFMLFYNDMDLLLHDKETFIFCDFIILHRTGVIVL
jgi:hypothetical protein